MDPSKLVESRQTGPERQSAVTSTDPEPAHPFCRAIQFGGHEVLTGSYLWTDRTLVYLPVSQLNCKRTGRTA
jgi:hypothetical protein